LTSDADGQTYGVVAFWEAQSKKLPTQDGFKEIFRGTSIWTLELDDSDPDAKDRLRILDNYYTSRHPATAGTIRLRRVSRVLRNSFK
jgi:hypothetical protein